MLAVTEKQAWKFNNHKLQSVIRDLTTTITSIRHGLNISSVVHANHHHGF